MIKIKKRDRTKRMTFTIPRQTLEEFKQKCKEQNISMSEAVTFFIKEYLEQTKNNE